MPRPPDTITRAAVNSGRADFVSSCLIRDEKPVSGPAPMFSTVAEPPSAGAASNPVNRTVITLIGSPDWTVARALPA